MQEKTNARVTVPVSSELKTIFERYNYEIPHIADQVFNRYIKQCCQKAGITDSVTIKNCFLTTGTHRSLEIGGRSVLMKNAAPKNFEYKNGTVCILVHALQSIGQKNITDEIKAKIPAILQSVPKDKAFDADLRLASAWIRKLIYSTL